jgi:hypothetical protein
MFHVDSYDKQREIPAEAISGELRHKAVYRRRVRIPPT